MSESIKVALVTGASRGIGRAIATRLGQDGYFVVGTATSDGGAEKISAWMDEAGIEGKGYCCNVTEPESVDALLKQVKEVHGPILTLVNNAGITRDNLLMRMKVDDWDAIINTNLTSVFRLSKAVMRDMMKARQGRIINIASVIGLTGNAGQANYAAAKAGIIGFSKSLAKEVGSRSITINTVAPGFIDTDMTQALPEAQCEQLLEQIPLAKLGQPEDIANAVAFLASDSASYITGETIHVNGGMYMP